MSDNQDGTGSPSSSWADAPWQPSSLSDSSLAGGPDPAASPFSRAGSEPSAELGSDPAAWPGYPPAAAEPPAAPPPPAYGPPYASTNAYVPAPAPYQPSYGGYTPYGLVPVNHPQASQALIFGILGLVLGLSCGVGAFFGIAGIVTGRKVRHAIDADPQRYTGRGMASAAIGLGIGGLVALGLWIALFAIGITYDS